MFLTVFIVVLNVIHVLSCVLMTVVILMQASKEGGGFGVAFGGAATETVFGSRAGNVLTKATIVLASIFLVSTLALAKIEPMRARVGLAARPPAADASRGAPYETAPSGTAPAPAATGVTVGESAAPAAAGEPAGAPSDTAPSGVETGAGSEAPASE